MAVEEVYCGIRQSKDSIRWYRSKISISVGATAAFNFRERVSIPKKRNAMMKMIAP